MLGTPRKGKRFGGDAAHQKAMMANLVASLIAAEGIVTTEAKAKAIRPVAEKVITKAKKGGLHNHRQVLAFLRDRDMTTKLFDELHERAQRGAGRCEGVARGDRTVGLDVEHEAIEVGGLLDASGLDREGHAPHRREDGVDRDDADGGRRVVALG